MNFLLDALKPFLVFFASGVGVFSFFFMFKRGMVHPHSIVGTLIRYSAIALNGLLFIAIVFYSPHITNDFLSNFLYARTTISEFSGHIATYSMVPVGFFVALWLTRNEFFSFAYEVAIVSIHELTWYGFDILKSLPVQNIGQYGFFLLGTSGFAIQIILFIVALVYVYPQSARLVVLGFIYTILFDTVWFFQFHWQITVNLLNGPAGVILSSTVFHYDFLTNLIEVTSWITLVAVMILFLYMAKSRLRIERLLGHDMKLSEHSWLK